MSSRASQKTIAVATTFSPRFVQVLSEAKRIRERFGADLRLIYVGQRSDDVSRKFRDVLAQLSLPGDSTIYYEEGDPADSIIRSLANNKIDMIVAGALEKEVVFHPFLGNVARRLVREASCSVMLFISPNLEPQPFRRIVFVADETYSAHCREALQQVLHLASTEKAERLYVIRIFTTFDQARATARAENEGEEKNTPDAEETKLEDFVLSAGHTEVPVEVRCIRGNTGFAAADFVHSVEADMLVVPVDSAADGAAILPPNISWLTDIIPCNLWVIR